MRLGGRELGLEVLEIIAHEDNPASQGVARAAGFTESGETHVPPGDGLARGPLRRAHLAAG